MRHWIRGLGGCVGLSIAVDLSAAAAGSVPESIEARDVPQIPTRVVEDLNRYQNIRLASFQDWSFGNHGILILTRFANTNQIHRVEAPLWDRSQLTFLPERV